MATLALPKSSKPTIVASMVLFVLALASVSSHGGRNVWLAIAAFLISGFLADLFTALAHFGFDYVFPEDMPILGPVAREFREHHQRPTLDPKDYVVNLSKGAYCCLPVTLIVLALGAVLPPTGLSFFILALLLGMGFWAFFFHQIHSYAHMGACLAPEEFNARVLLISGLPTKAAQIEEFGKLFEKVPIPPVIRFLQRYRIILNPEVHNLHHVFFETDFSSVNGWADPVVNFALRRIARRMKQKAEPLQA
jgi:Lipid desaturase domain